VPAALTLATPHSIDQADLPRPIIHWCRSDGLVGYEAAVRFMEDRVEKIAGGHAPELIWFLEHPPIYTAGTSAKAADLLTPDRFPVHRTGRGGQYTYHGPGQRVAYVMVDLKRRGGDVRAFVQALENWVIASLAELGVAGVVRPGRVGVWVPESTTPDAREDKIAAIGIRVRRWITYHGISLNVAPELEHFNGIVPCGIREYGVTSLAALDRCTAMTVIDQVLLSNFEKIFQCGEIRPEPSEL
jgi:lipoyl(octanoyl) transferase